MTPSNDVLQSLLANFPVAELTTDEQRRVFERLTSQLVDAPDAAEELKRLYAVKGFSDFATGLMWMVDRAEKNPGQVAIGPEDETLLLSSFRRAMGENALPLEPSASSERAESEDEKGFATQLDQFSEAVQSGSGGSRMLLEDLVNECDAIERREGSGELKELSSLLRDFLKFISEGELLDDVRVINIVSNVSSTVSQWANAPSQSRAGLTEEAMSMLRDFRSHFE